MSLQLQINDSGSWRNLVSFELERKAEVLGAVATFAGVLGERTRWCIKHPDGKREWLGRPFNQWLPITSTEPACLQDVMVSVFQKGDDSPTVYMAYRKPDGKFYLSGTWDQFIGHVYAWGPVMSPAPAPAQPPKQVAA